MYKRKQIELKRERKRQEEERRKREEERKSQAASLEEVCSVLHVVVIDRGTERDSDCKYSSTWSRAVGVAVSVGVGIAVAVSVARLWV